MQRMHSSLSQLEFQVLSHQYKQPIPDTILHFKKQKSSNAHNIKKPRPTTTIFRNQLQSPTNLAFKILE